MVFNKVDIIANESIIPLIRNRYGNCVMISAKTQQGIENLKRRIGEELEQNFMEIKLSCSPSNGKLIAYLQGMPIS